MKRVQPEDLDPYPGCFLKSDLESKVECSSRLLSKDYLAENDCEGCEEALNNITIAKMDALPKFDPFQHLCELQKDWQEMMEYTYRDEIALRMRGIIEGKNEGREMYFVEEQQQFEDDPQKIGSD